MAPEQLIPSIRPWLLKAGLVAAAGCLLAAAALLGAASPPPAAHATVTPRLGFRATVLGWSTWYGSYDMGARGPGWCIDHGLHAPDPSFDYVPTSLPDLDPATAAAISWAVAAHGSSNDPVEAAAVMLVLHDLRRASYPFAVLDVDTLTTTQLAGFAGHEGEVIGRARTIKAEARAHAQLRAPFHMTLVLTPSTAPEATPAPAPSSRDADGRAAVLVTDASGQAVVGAGVHLAAAGATIDGDQQGATGSDGRFTRTYRLDPGPLGARATIHANAIVPDPVPGAYASSTVRAQRVVHASWLGLEVDGTTTPTDTSTTTTSTTPRPRRPVVAPTTTTTAPHPRLPTTTTTSPPTTGPPTTTPPTTSPPTTGPPTTGPPTTGPPSDVATTTSSTSTGSLPRTGAHTAAWALVGAGLVLLGSTLVAVSRGGAA